MVRSARLPGAALLVVALALASAADAQTSSSTSTPTLHARAAQNQKARKAGPEGRQITVHKRSQPQQATPSWLTLGTGAPVGAGNNYVTSTFDQPTPIEGTFSGWRGRERLVPQYGVPGASLFQF